MPTYAQIRYQKIRLGTWSPRVKMTPCERVERHRECNRRWRLLNPLKSRAATRNWQKNNKHQHYALLTKKKYKTKKCIHPKCSQPLVAGLFKKAQELTILTGVRHEVDHIIPISCGGYHHHDNLQVLPELINRTKFNNPIWESPGYRSWRDVPEFLWPPQLVPVYNNLK